MKTKILKYFIPSMIIPFMILLLTGCKKNKNIEFTDSPILISYLEPGGYFMVTVSRQIPFSTDTEFSPDDIDKLSITVFYNNLTYLLKPLGDGKYIDSNIVIAEKNQYSLFFSFNDKNVSAYTYIPSKPVNMTQSATVISIERTDSTSGHPSGEMPDPIMITWDNTDLSYYLVVVENIESTLDPIRDFGDKEPPGKRFKKSPTRTASEEIKAMDFQYYGTHRIILYHVLPDYAALYEQGTTSSQNLTNPSTSIGNGYGIFTGLNSDTMYIEVKEK
jgi:hypothetical protein